MIVAGGGENLIAAAQHVLPHNLRRHVGVTRLGQIAVGRSADESAVALRVEPARGFAVGYDWSERRALTLITALSLLLLPLSAAAAAAALSAASALIASAPTIVTVISITVLSRFALLLSLSAAAALTALAALAGHCLRIVWRLRL
jgi:hypothetical protein